MSFARLLRLILNFPTLAVCFITLQSKWAGYKRKQSVRKGEDVLVLHNLHTTLGWGEWFGSKIFFGTRDFVFDWAIFINSWKSLFLESNRDFVVLPVWLLTRFSPCWPCSSPYSFFFCQTHHLCEVSSGLSKLRLVRTSLPHWAGMRLGNRSEIWEHLFWFWCSR